MRKVFSVVRVCTRVRLSDIVALRRPTLYGIAWVHDVSQVAMMVGCRLPENVVEVDTSAGLDVDSASAFGFARKFAVGHGCQQ